MTYDSNSFHAGADNAFRLAALRVRHEITQAANFVERCGNAGQPPEQATVLILTRLAELFEVMAASKHADEVA
jgi:hypothetical protein